MAALTRSCWTGSHDDCVVRPCGCDCHRSLPWWARAAVSTGVILFALVVERERLAEAQTATISICPPQCAPGETGPAIVPIPVSSGAGETGGMTSGDGVSGSTPATGPEGAVRLGQPDQRGVDATPTTGPTRNVEVFPEATRPVVAREPITFTGDGWRVTWEYRVTAYGSGWHYDMERLLTADAAAVQAGADRVTRSLSWRNQAIAASQRYFPEQWGFAVNVWGCETGGTFNPASRAGPFWYDGRWVVYEGIAQTDAGIWGPVPADIDGQIAQARHIYDVSGWAAWPVCSRGLR